MFSLDNPLIMLGPGQLVRQTVTFLPVSVEVIYPGALEITNFAPEWLQLVMDCQNMFPKVPRVSKALVALITHLLLDLHVELLDVVLDSIFPLEEFAALVAGYGGRGVGDHVSVQVPLTAQGQAAQVAGVVPVPVDLLHVSLENLHVFEGLPADLALHLLPVTRHQHLVRVPQVLLVRLLAYHDQATVRTLNFKLLPH